MNKLLILLPLFLAGCGTTAVKVEYKTIYVQPPMTLYQCPQIKKLPNADTLTNQLLADTVTKLYRNNKVCGINMSKLQEFSEKSANPK